MFANQQDNEDDTAEDDTDDQYKPTDNDRCNDYLSQVSSALVASALK